MKLEEKQNQKQIKNQNGITTIALVIAVVAVLLLATVTITLGVKLKGNTNFAKTGNTTTSQVATGNEEKNTEKEETKTSTNTANTKTTQTTSKGQSGTKVTAEQIAKNPEKYYGQEVKNYTKGDRVYRIFYVDTEGYFGIKNGIYLKADWVANDFDLFEKRADTYTPQTTKVLEKMNQQWAKERLNENWNNNEHWAAYLCDPTTKNVSSNQEWASYFDESKANYVIGSPSVEMFVKSYNQVSHTVGNYLLGASFRAGYYPGYLYTLDGAQSTISNTDYYTGDDTLDYSGYNSMYCGKNGEKGNIRTWLASPGYGCRGVCYVYGSFAFLCNDTNNSPNGVSPLVSLKSDVLPEI